MTRTRVGILISGRGSNMEALIRATLDPDYPAHIAVVISNRPEAKGLHTAAKLGTPTAVVDHKAFNSRDLFEAALDSLLRSHGVELIACAGFMRVLTDRFIASWKGGIINIHPSLLPAYRGLDTHVRALADGVKIHGCTVHFVGSEVDGGPIIAQAAVAVLPEDTPASLADRVLKAEHVLYKSALGLVASGRVHLEGTRVVFPEASLSPALFVPEI